jgi:hypothetical protein
VIDAHVRPVVRILCYLGPLRKVEDLQDKGAMSAPHTIVFMSMQTGAGLMAVRVLR